MTDEGVLPLGTVTFLLTDVEGSSTRWEGDPTGMAVAIARHYELLDEAISAHRGVRPVEQGEGDSVVGVFVNALDAVAAAVAAQRALSEELGADFRVRMAIHAGEAIVRADADGVVRNYMGRAIIRTARLRSCAHGGQVLVSGAAAELAVDGLPADISLADLGIHGLRDLARPERVFQVVHPDLPVTFPPLRAWGEALHTVPSPLTSFVGRDIESGEVAAALVSHRVVTLTGAGGVGKTRLAQQVAADLFDRHPAGTWWAALAAATTPEGAMAAIADGMRFALQPGRPPQEQIVDRLRASDAALVVLDNCEHLLEPVASFIERVLGACPSVAVMATSREPLGVPGERCLRIRSLSAPELGQVVPVERLDEFDAVRLFIERATDARPNLSIDAASAAHVVAICARLDGLPLAIELAAARARTLPIDRIASGLDDAFRYLTGGARTLLPRQQTLEASIAWSYEMLEGRDRTILTRLSVCPVAFDLDAAEAIAADGSDVPHADVLDGLSRLVDKGMIEFDGTTGRYRLLETIRQFSMSRLRAEGGLSDSRRRHAEHWHGRARVAATWGPTFDHDAMRSALVDWLIALDWAMAESGELADDMLAAAASAAYGLGRWPALNAACDWLLVERPHTPGWAAAVASVSVMATFIGRFDVFAMTVEAAQVALAAEDLTAVHVLRVPLIYATCLSGDLADARLLISEALSADDPYPAFLVTTVIAPLLGMLGQVDEVATICELGAQLTAAGGQRVQDTAVGPARLTAQHLNGDLDSPLAELPTDPVAWQFVARLWAAAIARLAIDRHDRDLAHLAASMLTADDAPMSAPLPHIVAWANAMLDDDGSRAVAECEAGINANLTPFLGEQLSELAATHAKAGEWAQTIATLDRLDSAVAAIHEPAPLPRAKAAILRARASLAAADPKAAEGLAHQALRLAEQAHLRLVQIDALEVLASAATSLGNTNRAARLLSAATAQRAARHYRGRLTAGAPLTLAEQLATNEPDAWHDGATLTLVDATAFAQRTRGPRGRPSFGPDALTPTEKLVVEHVAKGSTNAEVAAAMLISVPTVKAHLSRIYTKLDVRNRAELAATVTPR